MTAWVTGCLSDCVDARRPKASTLTEVGHPHEGSDRAISARRSSVISFR
jgi:hypothetical protein